MVETDVFFGRRGRDQTTNGNKRARPPQTPELPPVATSLRVGVAPGVGVWTTTVTLAWAMAVAGRVLVIDSVGGVAAALAAVWMVLVMGGRVAKSIDVGEGRKVGKGQGVGVANSPASNPSQTTTRLQLHRV